MNNNSFQRLGAISNTHVGSEFEDLVRDYFARQGFPLVRNFTVSVGIGEIKKPRRFDWGSAEPPILVECKSHAWTVGGNIPSAKMTAWNEAMYYFYMAPVTYRKVFFALKDLREGNSLAAYYIKCHGHMIPPDVEIWEYDVADRQAVRLL